MSSKSRSESSTFNLTPMETSLNLCANDSAQKLLKCFYCEKFLSVPPIYNHYQKSICGRCNFVKKPEDTDWIHQSLYEVTAQWMIFPCSNLSYGCHSQLKWGEVEDHENTCLYKKMNCPFNNDGIFHGEKCKWTGSGPRLNEHLESCHSEMIKKLGEFNFTEIASNGIYLTKMIKQLMVVIFKYEPPEKVSCLVMVNGTSTDCDLYRYQLELYDEQHQNTVILRRSRLEDVVGFEENLINPEKMLVVDLGVVKGLLKNPANVMGRFGIIKKSKREIHYGDKPCDSPFDENFLRELECSVCKNYMMPPIPICSTGHSFCASCKKQMKECPTCRHSFKNARNYTLEKLTSSINYPCMYKDAGCSVTCSSDKIRDHELICSFSGEQCFLHCLTGGVTNMFKHLKEKHQDSLIVAGDVNVLDLGDDEVNWKYHAICFGNDIFRLITYFNGFESQIKFSVQQFGVTESNYSYELELVCSTESSEKIVFGKKCYPLDCDLWMECLEIREDMIEKFISDQNLIFFKVNLRKIAQV